MLCSLLQCFFPIFVIMAFNKKAFTLIGVFFLAIFSSMGQVQIGFGGIYTMRMGEFKESNYKDGYGAMFSIYTGSVLPKSSPVKLRIGLGFNGSTAGSKKYEVETIDPADNTAKIRFKNNNNAMYWGVRLEKKFDRIAIYGDALYGMRNLHSLRKLQLLDDPEDLYEDESDRVTESKRVFYGFGGGLAYYMTKNAMLDFSVSYTISKGFTYLDMTTLEQDLNQICYKYNTSNSSNVLTFNLGLKFNLIGIGARNSSTGSSGNSTSNNSTTRNSNNSTRKQPVKKEKKKKKKIKVKTNPGGGGSKGGNNS